MSEETQYLLSRLRDKDEQIKEFQATIKTLKKELMEVCDWIEEYYQNEKVTLFHWSKLRGHLQAVYRNASNENYS